MQGIEATPDGCRIALHVAPRASRTKVCGFHDGRVKLAVAAPPVDGEANDEIVRFLARALGVPRDAVRLVSGATGKRKLVEIVGVEADEGARLLGLVTPHHRGP